MACGLECRRWPLLPHGRRSLVHAPQALEQLVCRSLDASLPASAIRPSVFSSWRWHVMTLSLTFPPQSFESSSRRASGPAVASSQETRNKRGETSTKVQIRGTRKEQTQSGLLAYQLRLRAGSAKPAVWMVARDSNDSWAKPPDWNIGLLITMNACVLSAWKLVSSWGSLHATNPGAVAQSWYPAISNTSLSVGWLPDYLPKVCTKLVPKASCSQARRCQCDLAVNTRHVNIEAQCLIARTILSSAWSRFFQVPGSRQLDVETCWSIRSRVRRRIPSHATHRLMCPTSSQKRFHA